MLPYQCTYRLIAQRMHVYAFNTCIHCGLHKHVFVTKFWAHIEIADMALT